MYSGPRPQLRWNYGLGGTTHRTRSSGYRPFCQARLENRATCTWGASLYNARNRTVSAELLFSIAPAISGSTLNSLQLDREISPGETLVEAELTVGTPHLWELNDPYMYRVSVSVSEEQSGSIEEHSTRCGFRDFRFEGGYFRLNGRRIFVKCAQTDARAPIGHLVAHDPDLPRRDLINCKATRHNMIRSSWRSNAALSNRTLR